LGDECTIQSWTPFWGKRGRQLNFGVVGFAGVWSVRGRNGVGSTRACLSLQKDKQEKKRNTNRGKSYHLIRRGYPMGKKIPGFKRVGNPLVICLPRTRLVLGGESSAGSVWMRTLSAWNPWTASNSEEESWVLSTRGGD